MKTECGEQERIQDGGTDLDANFCPSSYPSLTTWLWTSHLFKLFPLCLLLSVLSSPMITACLVTTQSQDPTFHLSWKELQSHGPV